MNEHGQAGPPHNFPAELRLLTKAEVAEHFRVTERTIESWMAQRLLPYRKIGRTIRFRMADLTAALDDRFLVKRRQ